MDHDRSGAPISLVRGADGALVYLVALHPSELPPVRIRDLEDAWHLAREAAFAAPSTAKEVAFLVFRFARTQGGDAADLVLADRDALVWADALDRRRRFTTRTGLSILLRLLGLLDLLARTAWARSLCVFRRDGADLDRRLLDAAARLPLTADGRLDETGMRETSLSAPTR